MDVRLASKFLPPSRSVWMAVVATLVLFALPRHGEATVRAAPAEDVDTKAVDRAIKKGVEYLKARVRDTDMFATPTNHQYHFEELVLYTLLKAGEEAIPRTDPVIKQLLARCLEKKLDRTYEVSLRAMILQELDPRKYKIRIKECAQWLADAQCKNGQWSYTKTEGKKNTATPSWTRSLRPPTRTSTRTILKRVPTRIQKKIEGKAAGDNSNSQYAALGVRACWEAGMIFPDEVLLKARGHWESTQGADGSWGYHGAPPYASMTHGGLASLAIYVALTGEGPKNSDHLRNGAKWIATNFSVTSVAKAPGGRNAWQPKFSLYCLYGLERAGMLYDVDAFGSHLWYKEGATHLLKTQKGDGAWVERYYPTHEAGTCFAILFLKKATRPIASIDR